MNVLLVDDQVRILSGLISGLDWAALGVTGIRTASSAQAAKTILLQEHVDILLCDIEMPGENGLSLLRWARQQGQDFVCVFLTSHADFLYAKEAIQLGSFDYILQPARYDEIQATIARAITRVKNDNAEKELLHYGLMAKNQESVLFQNLFSDWIGGQPLSIQAVQSTLEKLGKRLDAESPCFLLWGHLLRWKAEPWPTQTWVYAWNNILTEVYQKAGLEVLPFTIDKTSLGWFVYAPEPKPCDDKMVLGPLNEAYLVLSQSFPWKAAFYVGYVVSLRNINSQAALLLRAKQDNVLRANGIFRPSHKIAKAHTEKLLDQVQMHRWEHLLTGGACQVVLDEAKEYLDALAKTDSLNQSSLHNFWIQFQQVVLNAAQTLRADLSLFLDKLAQGNQAASLPELHRALEKVIALFPQAEQYDGNVKKLVDQACDYVEDNLDRPLNVNSVASALFVNADYLSRVFKNETGTSLKEHIIQRKMDAARMLLTTTELPVSVIASKLGYDNFSYFSQVYRRVMGASPTDERKKG